MQPEIRRRQRKQFLAQLPPRQKITPIISMRKLSKANLHAALRTIL